MKKHLMGAALGMVMVPGLAAADSCGDVTITEMNWASSAVITEVAKFIMENGYGCTVQKSRPQPRRLWSLLQKPASLTS